MNTFNDSEVLKKALVGVEFEFYSNKSIEDTAKEISILLGKKIRVEAKAHSDFEVTADEFKIEPDMSGGEKLMELVTGAVPYYSSRMMIIKVCKWIEENGYTNDRSSIHLNISFDKNLIENKYRISKMNVLKFILDFKEAQVFKFFPERKDSAYAKSIKFVLPKSDNFFFDGLNITPLAFTFPDSKYYGVNFEKRHNNYLEFRYIGGKDWEKKTTKILHLLDMFLMQLWKSTENTSFDPLHAIELRKILASNERIINARSSWKSIEKGWSGKVKLTVDLKDTPQIIDMHWSNIKERVLRLFSHGELESGHINYDSDNGMIQIEGGRLPYCVDLRGYEFVRCYVRGEFTECDFFGCDVNGSDIHSSNFYQSTQLNSSKLESSYVHQSCKLNDCYIYGNGLMKGSMTGGIFRMGRYDKRTAKFDKTEKILYTEV